MSLKTIFIAILFILLIYFTVYHLYIHSTCIPKIKKIRTNIVESNLHNIRLYKELKDSKTELSKYSKEINQKEAKAIKMMDMTRNVATHASNLVPLQHKKLLLITNQHVQI